MSDVVIYGLPHMTYVRTPIMILEEKGVEYDVVQVERQSEELARLHPFSRMPIVKHVTDDGTLLLHEGNAINQYLNEVFEGPNLEPDNARKRAQMRKWMNNVDAYYYPDLMRGLYFPRIVNPKRNIPVDEAAVQAVIKRVPHLLDVVEEDLAEQGYLAGDHVSLADFALFPIFPWVEETPEGREALLGRSVLNNWIASMKQRPSAVASECVLPD